MTALSALTALSCRPSRESHRVTFELFTMARAADSTTAMRPRGSDGDSVPVVEPPLLSSADLIRAKAVTRSKWYLLGGSQSTSSLVLTLQPQAAARLGPELDRVVAMGNYVAIVLDGQIAGTLIGPLRRMLVQSELTIDAGFFSAGDAKGRKSDADRLARQIQAGIP